MFDSADLVARWCNGEEKAAQLLYDQYRNQVYRLAYSLLGSAEDAEEAAQDALRYALMNITQYQPDRSRFSTWLHTITISRVRDRQRRRRFSLISLQEWMDTGQDHSPDPSPEQWQDLQADKQTVSRALQRLSAPVRETIVLRYWAEYGLQEIADILQIPLGTVQSRLRIGIKQLQKSLLLEKA